MAAQLAVRRASPGCAEFLTIYKNFPLWLDFLLTSPSIHGLSVTKEDKSRRRVSKSRVPNLQQLSGKFSTRNGLGQHRALLTELGCCLEVGWAWPSSHSTWSQLISIWKVRCCRQLPPGANRRGYCGHWPPAGYQQAKPAASHLLQIWGSWYLKLHNHWGAWAGGEIACPWRRLSILWTHSLGRL